MISHLTGKIIEKQPTLTILDVQGVGYEVHISTRTFDTLLPIEQTASLWIHTLVREDAILLFGFATQNEKEAFLQLIKISGIGAKTALAILSVMNEEELAIAIEQEDARKISSIPGIGKKTAERLILELRGKLHPTSPLLSTNKHNNNTEDIINTLLALGYNEREANKAIQSLPENIDISEGVKIALKNMMK
ncbi:MAG: Holliday junction branch migration protein RuvA [Neisseriaceae bacterium]|nr:Holliday junction branch migration protein RuvA [Neisseriaceae bacterium]